ncbi:MAG: NUDIX domain-containing protein, partial [Candidatus Pacearchaeota archaeon]|nr:NUDIX domain-containing protein [Candidatus Pacearchaeota archaeon]
MHSPSMGFNELWEKQGESNKFAYHLKVLEEDEFVLKVDNKYCLSHKGKTYVAYVDGESGDKTKFPLLGVICIVYDKVKDRYLMSKRLKEPFYGYIGFIGGKLEFSQYIYECARKEVKEETGLDCNVELKGIFSSKTYNNCELSYNHQMFVLLCSNPVGELLGRTREGENQWMSEEEIKKCNIFPNVL